MVYDGDLVSRGYFYPQHEAVYWIFDTNKLSEEEAKRITDEWVENLNKNILNIDVLLLT